MIECPNCHQSLPDWAQKCQHCGGDTSDQAKAAITEMVDHPRSNPLAYETPDWAWPAYYAMSALFILEGAIGLVLSAVVLRNPNLGRPSLVRILFGLVSVAVGIGLIAKLQAARRTANIFCWILIAVGVLSVIVDLVGVMADQISGVAPVVGDMLQIATSGFMIYLLSLTDDKAY